MRKSQPETQSKVFQLVFEPDENKIKEYETLLNSLYGLEYTNDKGQAPCFTFGIISENDETNFYVVIPEDLVDIFKKKYAVIDPYIQFEDIADPLPEFCETKVKDVNYFIEGYSMKLMYGNDQGKKLKTQGAEKNIMSNLIHSVNHVGTTDKSIIEITVQPINGKSPGPDNKWVKGLMGATNLTMKGITYLLDSTITSGLSEIYDEKPEKQIVRTAGREIVDLSSYPRFNVVIKLASKSQDHKQAFDNIKGMAAAFADLSDSNSVIPEPLRYDDITKRSIKHPNTLYTLEITQFLHLPNKNISSENIGTSNCKKVYDRNVPLKGIPFGMSNNNIVAFPAVPLSREKYEEMYQHIHMFVDSLSKPRLVLGQPGTGKSEWVINYTIEMAKLGIGVIIVDPKNDTQQRLIESLPTELMGKLIYINLGDIDHPPAMNIFRRRHDNDPTENSLIVSSFISMMKKEFPKSWGIRIQRILQMTAEAILLTEPCTLYEFELMLTEREYREFMIDQMKWLLTDDERKGKAHIKKLLRYWEQFNLLSDKDIVKEIEPVMNELGVFLSNRVVKSIVSQQESFDFRKAADEGKIVVINIPEGVLGDNTRLLASMINKAIWLDIQSRADVDISQRYPVAWVIDEAHEIVDDEFVGVLTKARAYRLGLTLVTQGLTNFKSRGMDNIKDLILTNCKNKIAFRLGHSDSRDLFEEFAPLSFIDLSNCPDTHFYAKIILEDGKISDPFFCSAPPMAIKIRTYDDFVKQHRSGMFTVDEIEDELEDRLDRIKVMNALTQ